MSKISRKLFYKPWGYSEGIIISSLILLIGLGIEYFTPEIRLKFPQWPINFIGGILFLSILLLLQILWSKSHIIKWLSSVYAAVCSIVLIVFLVLIMALVPQNEQALNPIGFDHMRQSWTFMFASFFVLTSLGLVTFRRALPLSKINLAFLINHLGLWILIVSAALGSGDLKRFHMVLYENQTTKYAYDEKQNMYEMPFAIHLHEFHILEYAPKLILANFNTGEVLQNIKNNAQMVEPDMKVPILDWIVKVKTYYPNALDSNKIFYPSNDTFASPAVYLEIENLAGLKTNEGWISTGSSKVSMLYMPLNDSLCLALTSPQPKRYSSIVSIDPDLKKKNPLTIEVNKPIMAYGWKLYQVSYNEEMGKYSEYSVIEVIRDPWLPIVYIGFFMLIGGSIYMFWEGKSKNQNQLK